MFLSLLLIVGDEPFYQTFLSQHFGLQIYGNKKPPEGGLI